MIGFSEMFSGLGGLQAGPVHILSLRQKAPRVAFVGATDAKKEGAK